MHRFWIAIGIICGIVLLTAALLIPAHSRAVDGKVLEAAGSRTPGLVEEGITLVQMEKVGPAGMLLRAAQAENLRGQDRLVSAIAQFNQQHPEFAPWGGADPSLENAGLPRVTAGEAVPVIELMMQRSVREKVIEFLVARSGRRPGLAHFLNTRSITNLIHFPAATSASGAAFDGAVGLAGLLYQGDHMTTPLRDTLEFLAMQASRGKNTESLELAYLDLISLAKRLDWMSLVELMKKVEDLATLQQLANTSRTHEEQFAAFFAASQLSTRPNDVTKYLTEFPQTGVNDLSFAAKTGVGGVEMLLKEQHRIHNPGKLKSSLIAYDPFGAWFYAILPYVIKAPKTALLLKYLLLVAGSLFLARIVGVAGGTTQWRGLRFGADSVLALAMAFILALLSEPFVGLPSQISQIPIRFHIPVTPLTPGSPLHTIATPLMNNELSLLPLVVFFVIQALIYIWCLAKLNEIRRQPIDALMKLRLLENEDHLFDAGLYIGFVGTILAMIMFSLGIAKFSLMSAYSSTSFGIIFVCVLKIFHVRPLRRKLIIESSMA
jgi:hypothetical protein